MTNYIKAKCPVCGITYTYPDMDFYHPKTCSNKDCALAYSHHPDRYISFAQHVDECRQEINQ